MSNRMKRRQLFALAVSLGAFAGTGLLVSCASTMGNSIQQIITNVDNLYKAAGTVISDIQPTITAEAYQNLQDIYTKIGEIKTTIDSLTSVSSASTAVGQFETIINTLITAVSQLPLVPPQIRIELAALAAVLPILESLIPTSIHNKITAPPNNIPIIPAETANQVFADLVARYNVKHNIN